MFDVFIAYLLLPPASTVHQCRTPGLSHLSPTSARSPLHIASLCFAPGSLHHRAKPHGAPTPHSSRHPTTNRINDWQTILRVIQLGLYQRFNHRYYRFEPTSSAVDCASSSCSFCGSSLSVASVWLADCLCLVGGAARVPGPDISCPAAVNTVSSVAGSVWLFLYWKGTLP